MKLDVSARNKIVVFGCVFCFHRFPRHGFRSLFTPHTLTEERSARDQLNGFQPSCLWPITDSRLSLAWIQQSRVLRRAVFAQGQPSQSSAHPKGAASCFVCWVRARNGPERFAPQSARKGTISDVPKCTQQLGQPNWSNSKWKTKGRKRGALTAMGYIPVTSGASRTQGNLTNSRTWWNRVKLWTATCNANRGAASCHDEDMLCWENILFLVDIS